MIARCPSFSKDTESRDPVKSGKNPMLSYEFQQTFDKTTRCRVSQNALKVQAVMCQTIQRHITITVKFLSIRKQSVFSNSFFFLFFFLSKMPYYFYHLCFIYSSCYQFFVAVVGVFTICRMQQMHSTNSPRTTTCRNS